MNTTCGSYTLLGSVVPDDAGIVKKLRGAGAIILGSFFLCVQIVWSKYLSSYVDFTCTGKSNMSEFSHARGSLATGWSGRGGQCTSAFFPGGDPAGSSSGSAVAVSIGLAPVALGTETDGSIVLPASFNNVVSVKPTVGLTSRAGGKLHPLCLFLATRHMCTRRLIVYPIWQSSLSHHTKTRSVL